MLRVLGKAKQNSMWAKHNTHVYAKKIFLNFSNNILTIKTYTSYEEAISYHIEQINIYMHIYFDN